MNELIVWDRFEGKLLNYIYENKIRGLNNNWYRDLIESENIKEFPEDLKEVARQYLTEYLKEHPKDKEAECLKIN